MILTLEEDLTAHIEASAVKFPFPAGYTPHVIEILFDDCVFIRSVNGEIVYLRRVSSSYEPDMIEIRFDDDTALLKVGDRIVCDRTSEITKLEEIMGRLESEAGRSA